MKRIATTLAIVLASATVATAAEVVTRDEPASLLNTPAELSLLPAQTVTITTGTEVDVPAYSAFTARDRAQLGLDATASVKQTVFPSANVGNEVPSPR